MCDSVFIELLSHFHLSVVIWVLSNSSKVFDFFFHYLLIQTNLAYNLKKMKGKEPNLIISV